MSFVRLTMPVAEKKHSLLTLYITPQADATVSPPLILAWAFEEVVGSCATDQRAIVRIAPIRKNDLEGLRHHRNEQCLDDGVG